MPGPSPASAEVLSMLLPMAVGADESSTPQGLLALIGSLFAVFAVYFLVQRRMVPAAVLGVFALLLVLSDIGLVALG